MVRSKKEQELLLGTLDMLILQTLVMGAAHGHSGLLERLRHPRGDRVAGLLHPCASRHAC